MTHFSSAGTYDCMRRSFIIGQETYTWNSCSPKVQEYLNARLSLEFVEKFLINCGHKVASSFVKEDS
jgi:hypothetical protein